MTQAPERVWWSYVPTEADHEDEGLSWCSDNEMGATEWCGFKGWRARGCLVVEYVQREAYDAAVAERDEARAWAEERRGRLSTMTGTARELCDAVEALEVDDG